MEILTKKVELIKIWLAVGLVAFGCVLVMMGFWAAPTGVIHNSVLIIFGEISAFVGSLFGINLLYSSKHKQLENEINIKMREMEKKEKEKEGQE